MLAACARRHEIRDPVYLCDTFVGVVKASEKDSAYLGGEFADTSEMVVENLCQSLRLTNVRILKGVFPDETATRWEAKVAVRSCHVKVDVYNSTKDVLEWVWPRMPAGAIVIFDDYGFSAGRGMIISSTSSVDFLTAT